jgi:hypothetical protein
MIEKEPFRKYSLKDREKIHTFRITETEEEWFIPARKFIQQPKISTAMKQLAEIGASIVLHDKKTHRILDIIMNNDRRNKRIGINEWDYKKDIELIKSNTNQEQK